MNHEFSTGEGTAHDHNRSLEGTGVTPEGSFISTWTIQKGSMRVLAGEDLIKKVKTWDGSAWVDESGTGLNFYRFCSADLPDVSAFYDPVTRKGTRARIFMNGEENGAEGRRRPRRDRARGRHLLRAAVARPVQLGEPVASPATATRRWWSASTTPAAARCTCTSAPSRRPATRWRRPA
ncbi:MAG: hypothetical protein R2726_16590 [Acidimicrobiales bacterium]